MTSISPGDSLWPRLLTERLGDTAPTKLWRLGNLEPVAQKLKNVAQFEELLRAEFESKWEAVRKGRRQSQATLFDPGSEDGLKLNS